MNLRASNNEKNVLADYKNIYKEARELKHFLREQIDLLNPNVLIVGGREGSNLINEIL